MFYGIKILLLEKYVASTTSYTTIKCTPYEYTTEKEFEGGYSELILILLLPREGLIGNDNFTFYMLTENLVNSFEVTIKSLSF